MSFFVIPDIYLCQNYFDVLMFYTKCIFKGVYLSLFENSVKTDKNNIPGHD